MKKISLTSIWAKFLSVLLFILITPLSFFVLFLIDEKRVWASAFVIFALVFIMFVLYMVFYVKIIIKQNVIIFRVFYWFKPKKYKIVIKNIENIHLENNINISNIIHIITNDSEIKFTGYNSLKGHKNNIEQSKRIVNILKEICDKSK